MGRTGRKRAHKNAPSQALDHHESAVNLRRFMSRNGFNDESDLKLRNFPQTGRGVAAWRPLHENDVIIRVPFHLLITYATLTSSNFPRLFVPTSKLTIHDLLAAFLVLQRHKTDSFWSDYIDSMPPEPPWLPALLSEERTELLPVDLKLAAKKSRRSLEESWSRLARSIRSDWTCGCCGKNADRVIDLHSFIWGYVLVNTRAVYVDPETIRGECDRATDILSDEPCMALCPFLDMFNHSDDAATRAEFVRHEGQLFYQLTTLTGSKKCRQVFISYGGHDNVKLLTEYGFFIPGNCYDSVPIQVEEVFQVLKLVLGDFRYKFVQKHGLNKSLFISEAGPSFNLKALLFVASDTSETKNLASVVYNDSYPERFVKSTGRMCHKLLYFHAEKLQSVLKILQDLELDSLVIDFLRYRLDLMKKLCDNKQ
jgi:hypothetical protein